MSGAKTEEPTTARVRKAREEGDSGASLFASQAVALLVGVALLPGTVAALAARGEERLRDAIQRASAAEPAASLDVGREAKDLLLLSLPFLLGIAIAGGASTLVQTGGFVALRRLAPTVERIRPFKGLGALVSRARLFAVGRGLAGGAFVAWVVARELRSHAPDIVRTSGRLAFAGATGAAIARTVAWEVALAGLVLGAIDFVVMRTLWRQRLRMSRDEVRRERRESEGDPAVKGERERAQEEVRVRGASAEVRLATIVVRDERRAACALRYQVGDRAPVVLVTGTGEDAERIVRGADEHGIPVREDASLAHALAGVEAGEPIPEGLYDAVAGLLRDLAG